MPAATYSSTGGCLLALVRVIASGRTCRAAQHVRLVSPASQKEYQIGAPILFHLTLDAGTVRKVSNVRCDDGLARIADVIAPDRFTWSNASHGRQALKAPDVTDQRAVTSGAGEVEVRDPTTPIDLARDGASADVAFSTLGVNACESMPVGNGEIALNSWAFPNGDVRLLIGKRDAFCGEVHVDRVSSPRTIGRGRNLLIRHGSSQRRITVLLPDMTPRRRCTPVHRPGHRAQGLGRPQSFAHPGRVAGNDSDGDDGAERSVVDRGGRPGPSPRQVPYLRMWRWPGMPSPWMTTAAFPGSIDAVVPTSARAITAICQPR